MLVPCCDRLSDRLYGNVGTSRGSSTGNTYSKGREASTHILRDLLATLAAGTSDLCVVIDGLNECEDAEMRDTLLTLTTLSSKQQARVDNCKVLVFSTDISAISKSFKKATAISLNAEKAAIDNAIRIFVHDKFEELRLDRHELQTFDGLFVDLERQMIAKAEGTRPIVCYLGNNRD